MQLPTVFGETSLFTKQGNSCYSGVICFISTIATYRAKAWSYSVFYVFLFFAVDILPNGNQQTDLMSIDSLSTVTGILLANEKTPETIFIPSFSCTVNCIRIQYVHIYSVIG